MSGRRPKPAAPPPERSVTVRAALLRALEDGPATAHDLSGQVGIREKDVAEHLGHLAKSLEREGRRLVMAPASCLACGFVFRRRSRFAKPGSCPECRATRIDPPVFSVTGAEGDGGEEE